MPGCYLEIYMLVNGNKDRYRVIFRRENKYSIYDIENICMYDGDLSGANNFIKNWQSDSEEYALLMEEMGYDVSITNNWNIL